MHNVMFVLRNMIWQNGESVALVVLKVEIKARKDKSYLSMMTNEDLDDVSEELLLEVNRARREKAGSGNSAVYLRRKLF
ncbi:Uncharacterised protein [uncultured archaeon]|nr:Uncharacterised protein [uncultured archaeon]